MKAHSLKVQQCLFVHLQVLVNSVNPLTILSDKAILRLVQPHSILVLCPQVLSYFYIRTSYIF